MNHPLRFELGPYWGTNTPALPLTLNSGPLFENAKRYGTLTNLREVREASNPDQAAPLALSTRLVFPEAHASLDKWLDQTANSGAYLDVWERGYSDTPVMGHFSNEPAQYMSVADSDSGILIPENTGHAIRLFLHEPGEGAHTFVYRYARAQFVLGGGTPRFMWLSDEWTQTKEDALLAILEQGEITESEQEDADELTAEIYRDYSEIDLGIADLYNKWFALEFEAEDGGYARVGLPGGRSVTIPKTEVLTTRRAGVLWEESPITIKSNRGQFFWQTGYPEHPLTGDMKLRFKYSGSMAGVAYNGNWHKPAGTNITFSHDYLDSVWSEITIHFSTTNPRRTPFLYAAQAFIDAGQRSGGDCSGGNIVLDVADTGNPATDVITEMNISQEGDFRRLQIDFEVVDESGTTFDALPGIHYQIGEHRTGNAYVGTTRLIKNGIVTPTQWQDLRAFTSNMARSQVTWPSTRGSFTMHDQWFLLEEYLLEGGELVGDGLYLGDIFRRGLRLLGIPYARMVNVVAGSGPYITPAALGEPWAEVNQEGSLADHFRYLLERYAFGDKLWVDNNSDWWYDAPSTSVVTLHGHPVEFSSDLARYDPDSYPGRYVILEELDASRTIEEFFNHYKGIGSNGYHDGAEPLVRTSTIHESISVLEGQPGPKFMGRVRKMQPLSGDWRSVGDLNYGLRSAKAMHGGIPNFRAFLTHFIPGLFVAHRVRVDGIFSGVRRIEDAPAHEDEMVLVTQQLPEPT